MMIFLSAGERDDTDDSHGPEGRAPAELLAEPRAEGHAEDIGHGEASGHYSNRRAALVLCDEAGRNDGTDSEDGAVRKRREDPCRHQHAAGRRALAALPAGRPIAIAKGNDVARVLASA